MPSMIVTPNEYRIVESAKGTNLAFVTMTVASANVDREPMYDEVVKAFNGQARPVKDSFRWLDASKNYAVGFVVPNREVKSVEGREVSGFREIAANIYMDEKDSTLWDMKDGHSGKYLARQGVDDLAHLLEHARVSPRGSTPRMYSIQQASVTAAADDGSVSYVAFVHAAPYGAEVDYGVCVGHTDSGEAIVVASSSRQTVVVPNDVVVTVASLETKNIPSIRSKVRAANAMTPKLTPEEYWKLQYSYNPEYMELVLKQVREMSAL